MLPLWTENNKLDILAARQQKYFMYGSEISINLKLYLLWIRHAAVWLWISSQVFVLEHSSLDTVSLACCPKKDMEMVITHTPAHTHGRPHTHMHIRTHPHSWPGAKTGSGTWSDSFRLHDLHRDPEKTTFQLMALMSETHFCLKCYKLKHLIS